MKADLTNRVPGLLEAKTAWSYGYWFWRTSLWHAARGSYYTLQRFLRNKCYGEVTETGEVSDLLRTCHEEMMLQLDMSRWSRSRNKSSSSSSRHKAFIMRRLTRPPGPYNITNTQTPCPREVCRVVTWTTTRLDESLVPMPGVLYLYHHWNYPKNGVRKNNISEITACYSSMKFNFNLTAITYSFAQADGILPKFKQFYLRKQELIYCARDTATS